MAGFGDPKLIRPEESNADRLILYTAELFIAAFIVKLFETKDCVRK